MKYLLQFSVLLSFFAGISQNHQLIDTVDYEKHQELHSKLELRFKSFNQDLKSEYKGRLRKEITAIYEGLHEEILEILDKKKLLFDERFTSFTQKLTDSIINNNPGLQEHNIRVFLTKDPTPNAISLGNGIILLNVGMFSMMENEYQLQSVIGHEMAHDYLEHTKQNVYNRANTDLNVLGKDSEFSRSVQSEKYNRGSKSFEMLKNVLYKNSERYQQNESEADSLGYLFYRNSNAPPSEFVSALASTKTYDSVPSLEVDSLLYKRVFDLPNQPFDDQWLMNESFDDYDYSLFTEKISSDSIKSHPEIDERILKLKTLYKELNSETSSLHEASMDFESLQSIANTAMVENLYYSNDYGLSSYLILNRLASEPSNSYYKRWLGINFRAMHAAKKSYKLNHYVDRVVPKEQSKSYQLFLNFIWNLRLNEINAIADFYDPINSN